MGKGAKLASKVVENAVTNGWNPVRCLAIALGLAAKWSEQALHWWSKGKKLVNQQMQEQGAHANDPPQGEYPDTRAVPPGDAGKGVGSF
ncbi:protein of unknown function [Beijerinckiaceae bacterium RH AL1]|nr:hypothetical protein [Beijerinckiaceae bacterium]VVB43868.1 protein of unknown function [Beijerinckiaceae bacterium RH CH11]VVB43896.1 protein of unknown function [Beijerinckiaceae bacterium RH AL8]VVC54055.1 protein of unknown function [Beijerinckiaceae bacterium RH AL1]